MNVPKLRFRNEDDQDFPIWMETKLGHMFSFKNGINASKEQYGHGVKFINVLDIINNDSIAFDDIIGSVNITPAELAKYDVRHGDILFQRSSETREEVGHPSTHRRQDQAVHRYVY